MCITESLFCTAEINTENQLYFNRKKERKKKKKRKKELEMSVQQYFSA